ncbi:MAG: potassium channel protein [Gammaproteobacteria bacterium HGW-Gammaproteobacteria-3]|nr:MAG: potassium channel protein [Gammaproteobacteria bacterium HGW-Gammaproteobacteria-3]
MLTRLIVFCAYWIKASVRYQTSKAFFYNLFENPQSRLRSYFDIFMTVLVMGSMFTLIHEVDHGATPLTEALEYFVVGVFVVEYIVRAWLYSDSHKIILERYEKAQYLAIPFSLSQTLAAVMVKKIHYMGSPLALIDLMAILPGYRPLQILRVFFIFRLFKLFRYSNSIKLFADVLASKRFELYTLIIFMGFLLFIASTAIYLFENPRQGGQVGQLFDAFYWAVVTLAAVGYGDITPQTTGGKWVTIALILSGIWVLSFFTSIIVAALQDKLHSLRENKILTELARYDNFVIICGFGRVGQEIARQLFKDGQKFVIIDNDENHVMTAKQRGFLALHNDASQNEVLENAGINHGAAAVLCTTGDDVSNVYIALTCRALNPQIQIVSRVNNNANIKKLYQAGANSVVQPYEIAGMLTAEYVGQPVAFEAIMGILNEEKQTLMATLEVYPDSLLENQKIETLDFKQRKLTLLGVISSNPVHQKRRSRYPVHNQHFYFNPEPDFQLRSGDIVVVLGRQYSIGFLHDQIEKSRLQIKMGRKHCNA